VAVSHDDNIAAPLDLLCSKFQQVLFLSRLVLCVLPAGLGGPAGDCSCQIRVQQGKERDVQLVSKHPLQKTISPVRRIDAVAVAYIETFCAKGTFERLPVDRNSELFTQVSPHPEVMVSGEVRDGDPGVDQRRELPEQPDIAPGDDRPLLKPVVEKVADDVQLLAVAFNHVQKRDDLLFLLAIGQGRSDPEMSIGKKVDLPAEERVGRSVRH